MKCIAQSSSLSKLRRLAVEFARSSSGNLTIYWAVLALPLIGAIGVGIDIARGYNTQSNLLQAADSAALAAARLGDATDAEHALVADKFLDSNFYGGTEFSNLSVGAVNNGNDTVTVTVSGKLKNTFMHVRGYPKLSVNVAATAKYEVSAVAPPCVLALHPSANDALYIDSNAEIDAPSCKVHTDSSSGSGLSAYSNSHITADSICVVGNYSGHKLRYTPDPTIGCPVIGDPLATVSAPAFSGCDYSYVEHDSVTVTLNAGVYCGGLTIKGNAIATFNPGIYIMKDGQFFIDSNSQASGSGVGFYLTGSDATLHFTSNTIIDFTAPTSGDMAGILFFEDRTVPTGQTHYFDSNNISRLEGTIYLSRGIFSSDSNTVIGAGSAFTNVIARKVWLNSNAQLTLNADYDGTSVPNVLGGLAGSVTRVMLVE